MNKKAVVSFVTFAVLGCNQGTEPTEEGVRKVQSQLVTPPGRFQVVTRKRVGGVEVHGIGYFCGADRERCSGLYDGSVDTLAFTATERAGFRFTGWSGSPCLETAFSHTCTIRLNQLDTGESPVVVNLAPSFVTDAANTNPVALSTSYLAGQWLSQRGTRLNFFGNFFVQVANPPAAPQFFNVTFDRVRNALTLRAGSQEARERVEIIDRTHMRFRLIAPASFRIVDETFVKQ